MNLTKFTLTLLFLSSSAWATEEINFNQLITAATNAEDNVRENLGIENVYRDVIRTEVFDPKAGIEIEETPADTEQTRQVSSEADIQFEKKLNEQKESAQVIWDY